MANICHAIQKFIVTSLNLVDSVQSIPCHEVYNKIHMKSRLYKTVYNTQNTPKDQCF